MFFKKRIDAHDFGPFLAREFLAWINSSHKRVCAHHRQMTESEFHIFVTKWLIACSGFIGAALNNDNSSRMAVLASYTQEIGPPARKGGYDFDPMEVMNVGRDEGSKYLSSDGFAKICADECAKILQATYGDEINESKAFELATLYMISDFSACYRLILFWLDRLRVIYRPARAM